MFSKIYWIEHDAPGKIGTMGRPRGNDWLEDEVKNFAFRGVDMMVSLLEDQEIYTLGLEHEAMFCSKYGIELIHFPIPDRDVPKDLDKAKRLITQLGKELLEGKKIVVHCRIGVGRSSTIVAAVLGKVGLKDPFEKICTARGMEVPDTKEQIKWVSLMINQK